MKGLVKKTLIITALILSAGCIKENLDDCYNYSLTFLHKGDGGEDTFSKLVNNVNLYIFNADGMLVRQMELDESNLIDGRIAPTFKLDPGKYTIVALGNAGEKTKVKISGDGDWSGSCFMHPAYGTEGTIDGHDHNYLGYHEMEMGSHKLLSDTLNLKSSHIDILLEVSGLQPGIYTDGCSKADGKYDIYFEGSNGVTDFMNRTVDGKTGICRPNMKYVPEENKLISEDLALFRMERSCGHVLKIISPQGNEVKSISITEYLEEHPEIDITKEEAVLPIGIKFSGADIIIYVPEWEIEDVSPEF